MHPASSVALLRITIEQSPSAPVKKWRYLKFDEHTQKVDDDWSRPFPSIESEFPDLASPFVISMSQSHRYHPDSKTQLAFADEPVISR
jgi:hypothetical protein